MLHTSRPRRVPPPIPDTSTPPEDRSLWTDISDWGVSFDGHKWEQWEFYRQPPAIPDGEKTRGEVLLLQQWVRKLLQPQLLLTARGWSFDCTSSICRSRCSRGYGSSCRRGGGGGLLLQQEMQKL